MQSKKPPRNCREAFTADGDQVFEERYYSSENKRPKFLSKDVDSEIRLVSSVVLPLLFPLLPLGFSSFHITLLIVISVKDYE